MPAERTTMRQVREAGHAWTAEIGGLEVEVLPPVAPDERPKAKGAAEDWPAFAKLFEQMREGKPDELARRICHLAMEGERDPVRLHDQALGELIPATMWRELS